MTHTIIIGLEPHVPAMPGRSNVPCLSPARLSFTRMIPADSLLALAVQYQTDLPGFNGYVE